MVSELTGLEIANCSLLDEATAAAEPWPFVIATAKGTPIVSCVSNCHPQTIEVVQTRAQPLGLEVEVVSSVASMENWDGVFGVLVQYPGSDGVIESLDSVITLAHSHQALVVVATDLLSLMLLRSPGALGADIAIGSAQRFGVPMGLGGPHAAFMATRDSFKRTMPGRIVGQSIDRHGNPAYRLALQTREQHIRREKATSNICTAQALLAMMSTLYACYHGPEGLRSIAMRVHSLATRLYRGLRALQIECRSDQFFDTIVVKVSDAKKILEKAESVGFNLRPLSTTEVGIAFDETTSEAEAITSSSSSVMATSRQPASRCLTARTSEPIPF